VTDADRDAARFARRVERVTAWLNLIEDAARELELEVLSRSAETASEAGTDPDPRLRPCEHRPAWMRGRLCLACDNTGLRPATRQEREEGLAYDPYILNPPRTGFAVRRDESAAAKRTRDGERIDALIASLQRDARIRAGVEVREGPLRVLRAVERITRSLGPYGRRVLEGLERLPPSLRRSALAREEEGLRALAESTRGRLRAPLGVCTSAQRAIVT
jgi:hypothetical protein